MGGVRWNQYGSVVLLEERLEDIIGNFEHLGLDTKIWQDVRAAEKVFLHAEALHVTLIPGIQHTRCFCCRVEKRPACVKHVQT